MKSNQSALEQAPKSAISPLPPPADPNMSRRQKQRLFEELKLQVLDLANRHFEQTMTILKNWVDEEPKQ